MCAAVKGRWVASAPSSSCVEANYVGTCKCAHLRAFSKRCLIKHKNIFYLITLRPSRATEFILVK